MPHMALAFPHDISAEKAEILKRTHDYLYPGRVERLLDGGIDFVPGRRVGYRYWDVDGRELLDLHLNGGTFSLGHRNPELIKILADGLGEWDVGNHHFGSGPKAEMAQALVESAPGEMKYVVLTCGGSEAIDVAIKSARYFLSDKPDEFVKVPFNDLRAMRAALGSGDVAAVLIETIPATYGFPLPEDDYLPGIRKLCDEFGILYIADEVQTGLGRTGTLWGVEQWGVEPDILVTGKGLSGGLYPVSATLLSERAADWLNDKGWGHVSTFGGSDLGCLVAKRVLEICADPATLKNARIQSGYLVSGLQSLAARFPFLEAVRHEGLVMGLKFVDENTGPGMMRALYENGVWAFIAGFDQSVVQFKPGLLIDREYCDELLRRVEDACIWFVRAMNEVLSGGKGQLDDAQKQPIIDNAKQALVHWGLHDADLEIVKQHENTVFKVTAGETRRYALRVHQAGLHSHSQSWAPPEGFVRNSWDEDGLLGDEPRMGRFWDHPALTAPQRREFLKARIVLQGSLEKLGKTESNFGLIHADFLPDNIIVNADGLTLIDFDDSGFGWHLYEMGTALLPQAVQPFFDDVVAAYLEGYRSERAFSKEDEDALPAFLMICSLNYLGWFQKRGDNIEHADRLTAELIRKLLQYIPQLMQELTLIQRILVNLMVWKYR